MNIAEFIVEIRRNNATYGTYSNEYNDICIFRTYPDAYQVFVQSYEWATVREAKLLVRITNRETGEQTYATLGTYTSKANVVSTDENITVL